MATRHRRSSNGLKSPMKAIDSASVMEMSSDEMRNALYERLHNKGLLDALKSQLRNYLVSELQGKGHHQGSQAREDKPTLERKVLESLIYKYLCDMNCDYTVGVFLPEAGITKREMLSIEELRKLLKLPSNYQTGSGDSGERSLLLLLVSQMLAGQVDGKVSEESTQTDTDRMLLTDRLAHIDSQYANLATSSHRHTDIASSVEEKLLAHQRKIELAANQKAREDLERWKRLEVQTIQVTERENQYRELQDRRRQLEEEYRKKVAAVTEREKSLTDSVKVEYETTQRETFMQRQQLLQQTEELRRREAEIREEKMHTERLQRANEEKVEKMEQMLKKREADLYQKELHMDNTLRIQQERCRMEEKLAYDSKYRELKAWEERLKDKQLSVEREKKSLLTDNERKELLDLRQSKKELEAQVNKYSLQSSGLEITVSGLHERLAKMFDYEVLKESNISLKKDLQMTKDRLDTLLKEHCLLQEKYEHMMIDGREKAGVGEIMLIKTQIQKERDRALDDKVLLEHRLKEMEAKFTEQLHKNQMMTKEFELQTDRQRHMNKEYGELRKQFGSADASLGSRRRSSPLKDASFYDTTFRQTLPPELALDADWPADISSGAEVSTATEESIVTETRRRLDHLTTEAENLHSAFKSLTRQTPATSRCGSHTSVFSPSKSARTGLSENHVTFKPTGSLPIIPKDVVLSKETGLPAASRPMSSNYDTMPSTQGGSTQLDKNLQVQELMSDDRLRGYDADREASSGYDVRRKPSDSVSSQVKDTDIMSQADQFNRPTPNKMQTGSSSHSKVVQDPPTSLDSRWKAQPASIAPPMPLDSQWKAQVPSEAPPTSLDSQWKTQATSIAPSTSLDSQWKAQVPPEAPPTSLDSQWRTPTTSAAPPTSLDSQWKTQATSIAPPTSLDSQWKTQAPSTAPATALQVDSDVLTGNSGRKNVQAKEEDDMAGIDPTMQKYMKMIQKQKEEGEKKKADPPVKAALDFGDERSVSEEISLVKSDNGGATDDDFW